MRIVIDDATVYTLEASLHGLTLGESVQVAFQYPYDPTQQPADRNTPPEQCPCQQTSTGDPIDTRTGATWLTLTDLAVPGPGPDLAWERSYVSRNTALISGTLAPLGAGWQHRFATHLLTDPAEPGVLSILTPRGNRFRYQDHGNGTYTAFPGIFNTLTATNGVYTQTLRNREQWVFDGTSGALTAIISPDGGQLNLVYTAGRLTQIVDADAAWRQLNLTYTGDQITAVTDGAGRSVGYTYDAAVDLTTVTDVAARPTTYTYTNHLLTGIDNALSQPVMRTGYDVYTAEGKAITQTLLTGEALTLAYLPAMTTITTTSAIGETAVETLIFGPQNTVTQRIINGETVAREGTDSGTFAPAVRVDSQGQRSVATYTALGQPQSITNALGEETRYTYTPAGDVHMITDTLGLTTIYTYTAAREIAQVTTNITTSTPLGQTMVYTYSPTFPHQVIAEQDMRGLVTTYGLDDSGRVLTTTLGANTTTPQITVVAYDALVAGRTLSETTDYGTAAASTTHYGYDALGRVVTTTLDYGTPIARADVVHYTADDQRAATILNFQDGVYSPTAPDADIVTTYGYDALGRQTWVRDPGGRYHVTHYTLAGRVDWTLRNLAPVTFDLQGAPILPTTPPAYDPAQPDVNLATLTAYDGLGRTTLVTQTGILTGAVSLVAGAPVFSAATTRVTRTEYDAQSRPITVTENYQPTINGGQFDPAQPDVNVQTLTHYDADGNVTWTRDVLGRWTHTEYDPLQRPVTVTLNYEDGSPLTIDPAHTAWADPTTTDRIQVTHYRPDGAVQQVIENYVDGTFTVTEPLTDRITWYDYDAQGRVLTTTLNYDPATVGTRTDTNLRTARWYDPLTGQGTASQDVLGQWTVDTLDAWGRVTQTTTNCRTAAGVPTPTDCAAFAPQTRPDRNVPALTRYDATGRIDETEDALGVIMRTERDHLTRTTTQIQQYVPNTAPTSTTNLLQMQTRDALDRTVVTTRTVVATDTVAYRVSTATYDALGQLVTTTTPAGTTAYAYTALGQTAVVTDTANDVTRYGYDGTGTKRWEIRSDGQLTVYQVDGLGRTVLTIQNYQNGVVDPGEAADQDILMPTQYDAAGRVRWSTNAGGQATALTYDLADHLTRVTENATTSGCIQAPCTVTTTYTYDRQGNRTAVTDALLHTRTFAYDAADRQIAATDALSMTTTWTYDQAGRRLTQDDPRGAAYDLTWSYNETDALTSTQATTLAAPIVTTYDAGGRRTQLSDGSGATIFAYTPLGQVTQVTRADGTVRYQLDSQGKRTAVQYPDGRTLTYGYDTQDRLTTVRDDSGVLATYAYDPQGRVETLTRANGAVTSYTYDAEDRPLSQTTLVQGNLLSAFVYQLDPQGQRTVVTETLPLLPAPALMLPSSQTAMPSSLMTRQAGPTAPATRMVADTTTETPPAASLTSAVTLTAQGTAFVATTPAYTAILDDQGIALTAQDARLTPAERQLALRVQQGHGNDSCIFCNGQIPFASDVKRY